MSAVHPQLVAFVPCAGVGQRALTGQTPSALPKQYQRVAGRSLLAHALTALCAVPQINRIVVITAPNDGMALAIASDFSNVVCLPVGGATRAETVRNALAQAALPPDAWALVHDAARCCVRSHDIASLIDTLRDDNVGGLLAVPVADTVKVADASQRVSRTQARDGLWLAQTPQMFRAGLLARALQTLDASVTDEASAIERLGHAPKLVQGSPDNIKVTYPSDFALAETILKSRAV